MKKLVLKKDVVARINNGEMNQLRGGYGGGTDALCTIPNTQCECPITVIPTCPVSCHGTCNQGTCPVTCPATCAGATCNQNTCYAMELCYTY